MSITKYNLNNDLLDDEWDNEWGKLIEPPVKKELPLPPRKPYKRKKYELIKKDKDSKIIRYKIYHRFKYNPKTQTRTPQGKILYCYEHEDKLVFLQLHYQLNKDRGGKTNKSFSPGKIGILKYKKGKDNTGRFNFYLGNRQNQTIIWRNASNNYQMLTPAFGMDEITKTHVKRINKIIKKFALKYNRKFIDGKTLDDVCSGIIRLCYPVLDKLSMQNGRISYVLPKYCKKLRNPNSRLVKSLIKQKETITLTPPKFFRLIYVTEKLKIPIWTLSDIKCIKWDGEEKAMVFIYEDGRQHCYVSWEKERYLENIKSGSIKEIPLCEVALMI